MTGAEVLRRKRIMYNGCWKYLGGKWGNGYGKVSRPNGDGTYSQLLAHRVVYEYCMGIILDKKTMLHHSCYNPICINPEHLVPGTQLEHMQHHKDLDHFPCGHPRTIENTNKGGNKGKSTACRECAIARSAKSNASRNAKRYQKSLISSRS